MIEVKNLKKQFGELSVLNGITEHISQGEKIAVIGPSGSGKSTFLRCLNLLEIPTEGEIWFDGVNMTDVNVDIDRMRQKMGMVFQHFNLFPHLTVLENIILAPVHLKLQTRKEAEENARRLLERIGLLDKADTYPAMLSGGQKQRAALARTMVMKPKILLLDEPLSALDGVIKESIKEKIRQIARDYHLTTIIVTHDPEEALTLSDKVLIVNQGGISQYGTPEEIVFQPDNQFVKDFILNQLEIKRKNIFRLFNRTVDSLDRSFQEAGAGAEVCVREQAV